MPIVVGVAFRPVTKVYYFDPQGLTDLKPGDAVVVETSRGRTLGKIVFAPKEVEPAAISGTLKPVIRKATAWDLVQQDQMAHREPEALQLCRQRARALGLPIKVIRVEFSFDGSSAIVYFTSEQRVDFRNLVHELSQALRTHVEMRQVGVRDEAKFLGGIGRCGRELCCSTWLREFAPVSIKMAKAQDLPINAPEVSGVCGRLLCCLAYENDFYVEARRHLPRVNSVVQTPQGPGKVKQVHVLAHSITVQVEGPNDTRVMVDMTLPEPEFTLGPKPSVSQGAEYKQKLSSEPAEAGGPLAEQETEVDEEKTEEAKAEKPAMPAAKGSTSQRSRSRRKRR
ncbi:MAG: PSP1 domain-containing protein [Anaerolineae bacterium]